MLFPLIVLLLVIASVGVISFGPAGLVLALIALVPAAMYGSRVLRRSPESPATRPQKDPETTVADALSSPISPNIAGDTAPDAMTPPARNTTEGQSRRIQG